MEDAVNGCRDLRNAAKFIKIQHAATYLWLIDCP